MKKNVGTIDRIIRTLVALVLGILILTEQVSGAWAIIAGIVAIAFLVTSAISWCPGYFPFGLSTKKGD